MLRGFTQVRNFSALKANMNIHDMPGFFDVLIVGGGSAGINLANRYKIVLEELRQTGDKRKIGLIEPSMFHYYQPGWTLVGAGARNFDSSFIKMDYLIPYNIYHLADKAIQFDPENNSILLARKGWVSYSALFVCTGIEPDFESIKGLPEALETPYVCSNYSPSYVKKTWKCLEETESGNAIFTFPNGPIKCPGAPQKIMYLADHYWRKQKRRDKINIYWNSALPVIFSVKKYANELDKICKKRDLTTNFRHNLVEVIADERKAIFENLDTKERKVFEYDMLHVSPPHKPSAALLPLADANGFVDVDRETLQHKKYVNIFALGDCTNLPTSKTAAAVAAQTKVAFYNLINSTTNFPMPYKYDGYTSCPLITGYRKCILAEFDYNLQPLETFPFNQGRERWSMYFLKKTIMPWIYWWLHLPGRWSGPAPFRKLFRLGFSK